MLAGGRVVETGRPAELARAGGAYTALLAGQRDGVVDAS